MTPASNSTLKPSETVWDAAAYDRNARFVSDLGLPVLDLLAPVPGERILDLGCGDGALTAEIAKRGATVVGVDPSESFVAAARARGLDARVMAGERLTFAQEFDAVFSNAALHWVRDHDAMLAGVFQALKPGGRFAAEMGGAGNVAKITAALVAALARRGIDGRALDPWTFPTPDDFRVRLERHGFEVEMIRLIERPTPLPGGLGDWLETFAQSFLAPLAGDARASLKREVEAALDGVLKHDGLWVTDYVRLRFRAVKPA